MDVRAIDHLEIFTEDAEETAARLCAGFGFTVHGRGGPDTGRTDCLSILLRQHDIALLVTTPLAAGHRGHEYLDRHGEGIAVVGFAVDDAAAAFTEAIDRGALPLQPPDTFGSEGNAVTVASVDGFGDVEHRFTSRHGPSGPFARGVVTAQRKPTTGLLREVDHLAVCLPAGELDDAIRRYRDVFDLEQTFEERIIVGSQAMRSKVVQSASRGVTFTIIEPDLSRDPGQVDAFIEAHGGAGVQHVAFRTDDIVSGVRTCGARGVPFLSTPGEYYQELPRRLGSVGVTVEQLRELSILADRDYAGVMLQIFTASVHPRRTLFYELIERRGARTFGTNNIKALYEAVEREQAAAQA